MQTSLRAVYVGIPLAILIVARVSAHGTSDVRLEALDREIDQQPTAALLIRRGRVHFDSEHWQAALGDFRRAVQLQPIEPEALFWQAEVYRQIEQPDIAIRSLQNYLSLVYKSPRGHWRLADLYAANQDFSNAEHHYRAAIAFDNNPPPQLFQDRINKLIAQQPRSTEAISAAIESALNQHPHTITLVELVLDYYELQGDYGNAIDLLNQQPLAIKQAPKWLLRKGEWQIEKGDITAAKNSLNDTIKKIQSMPAHRKNLAIFQEIRINALSLLEAL